MTISLYSTLHKWTLDRYHAAIEAGLFDDQAVELLKEDIVVMAPEREAHACYSSDGADCLRWLLSDRASVRETKPVTFPMILNPFQTLRLSSLPYADI